MTPQIYCFYVVLWLLSSRRHFIGLTFKYSVNPITSQKMLNLENTVTRLKSIVLSKTYDADQVSETLDLLRCNSY